MEFFSSIQPEIYDCYAYGRLSKEDAEKAAREKQESDSIKNQRELLHDFIDRHADLRLCMEGYDDNCTGTNFDRPHFKEMIAAIEAGRVNCVVVKDLSRFGREYIDSGRYIQKLFPAKGVRFIAITDGYDSAHPDPSSSLMVPFKNLVNDSYCRDTSIKIRSHLDVKRRNGEFIGSFAAYGYAKDPENKNHLIIDPEAAGVVRDIYDWKIAGMSNQTIADRLNNMGVLSPMEYKKAKGIKFGSGYSVHARAAWSSAIIRRILTSVVYLGILEQGKRTTPNYKVKTVVERPPEEWMRVEGTHDPIVTQEEFDLAARLLLLDTRAAPGEETVYPLAGLLYCGDCHSGMSRKTSVSDGQKHFYYVCGGHKKDKNLCSTHSVRVEELDQAVLDSINLHIQAVADLKAALEAVSRKPARTLEVSKLNRRLDTLQQELEKARELKDALYRRYALGEIDKEDFLEFKRIFNEDCARAEQAIETHQAQLDAIVENASPISAWIAYFQQFGRVDALTRPITVRLIDQVRIYEGGRVEVMFRYQAEYEMACQYLAMQSENAGLREAV